MQSAANKESMSAPLARNEETSDRSKLQSSISKKSRQSMHLKVYLRQTHHKRLTLSRDATAEGLAKHSRLILNFVPAAQTNFACTYASRGHNIWRCCRLIVNVDETSCVDFSNRYRLHETH